MGYYVNPQGVSTLSWLRTHGVALRHAPDETEFTELANVGELPVCCVDNGPFYASGVVFSVDELLRFSSPADTRPKLWFAVPVGLLIQVGALPPNWQDAEQG